MQKSEDCHARIRLARNDISPLDFNLEIRFGSVLLKGLDAARTQCHAFAVESLGL